MVVGRSGFRQKRVFHELLSWCFARTSSPAVLLLTGLQLSPLTPRFQDGRTLRSFPLTKPRFRNQIVATQMETGTTSDTLDLKDTRILITGGGKGIGKAIALIFAELGAKVAIVSRTKEDLESVASEAQTKFGADILVIQADVTQHPDVDAMVQKTVNKLGGIDILVNNAGRGCKKAPAYEQSAEDFREMLDLNVVSVLMVSSAVLRHAMLQAGNGHIISISSRAGKIGIANNSPYCASKFALEGLTASMSEELKSTAIRVNTISPGMVNTPGFPKPSGRPGVRTAESVREALLMLLGSNCTGKYVHVDEFDTANAKGLPALSMKPINEPSFQA